MARQLLGTGIAACEAGGSSVIYVVVGTRPEVIKMAPVVRGLREIGEAYKLVAVRQHTDLLDQALAAEGLEADFFMDPKKVLGEPDLAADFGGLHETMACVLMGHIPDLVLVQGDTNTAFAAALAAWHHQIPVGHVEAGLRSSRRDRPFPEEGNRRLISQLASLHFCPTVHAAHAFGARCGNYGETYITGNTSIDQLMRQVKNYDARLAAGEVPDVAETDRPWVFVTVHRRENLEHLGRISEQICKFAVAHPEGTVVWPVHPNSKTPFLMTTQPPNLHLVQPVPHGEAVCGIRFCDLVVTDSGGVVEEATTLGKRILVLRDETERPEAIESGHAALVPASAYGTLANRMQEALALPARLPCTVFGDGTAGRQIAELSAAFVRRSRAS